MRMCQGSRGRCDINEHVKNSEPDKQYDAWLLFFFFSLYMYLSYIFYFKESTIITTENNKQSKYKKQKKYIQKCGGQVASNIVWLCPSNKTKFSFFLFSFFFFFSQLVLNLHPYILVPFTIKGREPPRSPPYLFSYFLFLSLLLAKNKSLSSSSLKWLYNFKQICFPPKLAANEQLQQCFFGYSRYGPLFMLRISSVIKFLTNPFPFLSFVVFSLMFVNFLLTSRKVLFFSFTLSLSFLPNGVDGFY